MANLNDILNGLVNINSKMANNINNLLDSIGEGFLDIGELTVENDILSLQGATILVNGSNILIEDLSTTFVGNRICFLEYKADKSIALKVLPVVDANFNYDLSQLSATSKHFEVARQYNGVLEDRRIASMASKDNTIVGALSGALKAIDYDDEIDLEINMDILSRISSVESDILNLESKKADKTYVDDAVANADIDGIVKAVDVGEVEDIDVSYVTRYNLYGALEGFGGSDNTVSIVKDTCITDANDIMNIQGIRFTNSSTLNLSSELDIDSKWGVLKTYVNHEGDGVQEFTSYLGGWKGTIFRRYIQTTDNIFGDWFYILDGDSWGYSLQTNNKTIIGAINELFQSANNGKELIASSIGEPLSADDTFQAMSNDINSLLSTFKTNMMKNGVTVESGDKFKALIDKVSSLADNEGKGIQYAEGTGNLTKGVSTGGLYNYSTTITDFNFLPTYVFCYFEYAFGSTALDNYVIEAIVSNLGDLTFKMSNTATGTSGLSIKIRDITNGSFTVTKLSSESYKGNLDFKWYAIGVGEEDTTLRDSLASILQDSGVEVIEDDDMASLITKVDTELDEATSNKNRLYDLMLEGGYEVNSSMNLDSLLDLLEQSGISVDDIKQIEIACGTNYTFILKNDGSLWACGDNDYGQLGLNTTTDKTSFTQVTPNINNDVKQVACGTCHTVIIKTDGSLWGCGYNYYNQLGLSDPANKHMFVKITTNINNDVKQVACGDSCTFILKNDGSLWSCGYNSTGQLGLGDSTDRRTFTQVTTNINNDVKQVACGYEHTFILKNDGSVWSCGRNSNGQLGLGDTTDRSTFTQVTENINNNVKQITCGYSHIFVLKNDGSIWSCGDNSKGQLGLNTSNNRIVFTQVPRGF